MAFIMKDYFKILGISRNATEQAIRIAYHNLCLIYHPDKGGEQTTEVFQGINEAYEVLKDEQKRNTHRNELEQNDHQGFNRGKSGNSESGQEPSVTELGNWIKKLRREDPVLDCVWRSFDLRVEFQKNFIPNLQTNFLKNSDAFYYDLKTMLNHLNNELMSAKTLKKQIDPASEEGSSESNSLALRNSPLTPENAKKLAVINIELKELQNWIDTIQSLLFDCELDNQDVIEQRWETMNKLLKDIYEETQRFRGWILNENEKEQLAQKWEGSGDNVNSLIQLHIITSKNIDALSLILSNQKTLQSIKHWQPIINLIRNISFPTEQDCNNTVKSNSKSKEEIVILLRKRMFFRIASELGRRLKHQQIKPIEVFEILQQTGLVDILQTLCKLNLISQEQLIPWDLNFNSKAYDYTQKNSEAINYKAITNKIFRILKEVQNKKSLYKHDEIESLNRVLASFINLGCEYNNREKRLGEFCLALHNEIKTLKKPYGFFGKSALSQAYNDLLIQIEIFEDGEYYHLVQNAKKPSEQKTLAIVPPGPTASRQPILPLANSREEVESIEFAPNSSKEVSDEVSDEDEITGVKENASLSQPAMKEKPAIYLHSADNKELVSSDHPDEIVHAASEKNTNKFKQFASLFSLQNLFFFTNLSEEDVHKTVDNEIKGIQANHITPSDICTDNTPVKLVDELIKNLKFDIATRKDDMNLSFWYVFRIKNNELATKRNMVAEKLKNELEKLKIEVAQFPNPIPVTFAIEAQRLIEKAITANAMATNRLGYFDGSGKLQKLLKDSLRKIKENSPQSSETFNVKID